MITFSQWHHEMVTRAQAFRRARLWKITRQDGEVFYITEHDQKIQFEGNTYSPTGGFEITSRVLTARQGATTNFRASGIVSDDVFSYASLRASQWSDAVMEEYVVDWKYPWIGSLRSMKYFFGNPQFDEERFSVVIEGVTRFLTRRAGRVTSKVCPLELFGTGLGKCNASSVGHVWTGVAVLSVTDRDTFKCLGGTITGSLGADWFADGKLTWTVGDNAGIVTSVRASDDDAGGAYTFDLNIPAPFDIAPGDLFTIESGCDHLAETCDSKFGNMENYGGQPHTPPTEVILSPARLLG